MLLLSKMASQINDPVVSCQLGGQNIKLYLILLGTPHGTPQCLSAIVQSSFQLPAASSLVLLIVA